MIKHTKGPWGTRYRSKNMKNLITDRADSLEVRILESQNLQGDALLIRSAPEMLQLLIEANTLWGTSNPNPKSTSAKINEMISRFEMEPESKVIGTAADLI
jgi:hypothetical protein